LWWHKGENGAKTLDFAGDFGRILKVNKWKLSDIFAASAILRAQMASLRQLFIATKGVKCDFVRRTGTLWAFCATIVSVAAKNLAPLALRRWRRRTRNGRVAIQVQQSQRWLIQQQASLFMSEQRELCDLLKQQATVFAKTLVQAREVRVDCLRTLILLRKRVREYARQHDLNEKRLLQCVMQRLKLSRILGRTTLWNFVVQVRQLEKVYQTTDFESVSLDSTINEFLRLRDDVDVAVKLRNYMRAIVRQYVDVTDRNEAIRFLRELVAQLELS
jgi:hypothetical protein